MCTAALMENVYKCLLSIFYSFFSIFLFVVCMCVGVCALLGECVQQPKVDVRNYLQSLFPPYSLTQRLSQAHSLLIWLVLLTSLLWGSPVSACQGWDYRGPDTDTWHFHRSWGFYYDPHAYVVSSSITKSSPWPYDII